jgi:hypothetical protein
MLEATRQVSQSTIPGRIIIVDTGITGRLAVAIWEATAVTGEVSAVIMAAAGTAAAGIADRTVEAALNQDSSLRHLLLRAFEHIAARFLHCTAGGAPKDNLDSVGDD